MCFLFQSRHTLLKPLISAALTRWINGAFQCGEMTLNAMREFSPFCRWSHHKCAAICFAHCARDQAAPCQTIRILVNVDLLCASPRWRWATLAGPE